MTLKRKLLLAITEQQEKGETGIAVLQIVLNFLDELENRIVDMREHELVEWLYEQLKEGGEDAPN